MKFSVISSENKLVTLLKIYFVKMSNLLLFDLEIKQAGLIWLITLEKAYLKSSIIVSPYFWPLVSP